MGFGTTVGSISQLKQSLEKNSSTSDDVWIKYIPKNGDLNVRFLSEPDTWASYHEAWNPSGRGGKGASYPVPMGEEVPDDHRVSKRYLANALDIDNDRVVPVCISVTLMQAVVLRYEKHGTITDRDYVLSKSGAGKDTKYMLTPEAPLARKMDKYEPVDLEKVLEGAYNSYIAGEGGTVAPTVPVAQDIPVHDDDPVEAPHHEAFADDDETPEALTREQIMSLPLAVVRAMAQNNGIGTSGLTKDELADALTGADAL